MINLFQGYYGYQNSGDDAFIEVAAWGAKQYWHCSNINFIAHRLPVIKTKAFYSGKELFRYQGLLKTAFDMARSDAMVCAGGSTFHSSLKLSDPKQIALFKKKVRKNFKIGAIGVSLGPFRSASAESANIELLKHFDFLTLRDTASYQLALSFNLPFQPVEAFDLAALLPSIFEKYISADTKKTDSKILGISVCNYESYINNGNINNQVRRNDHILNLIKRIAQIDPTINFRFFVFNGNPIIGDIGLTHEMTEILSQVSTSKIEIIPYNPSVFETWLKINECSVVLSTRLHAAIFACFANIPFFLIEYHRKCTDLLDDIGYDSDMRVFDAEFDIEVKATSIAKLLNNEIKFKRPTNFDNAISKALLNFTENAKHFTKLN